MMTRRSDSFVLTLLMAVVLMAGCGKGSILPHFGEDGSGLPQALLLADSLMNSRPDSALAVLEGAEGDMAGEPKSVRMRYQLLRHQAMNKAFVPFTSDSLMLDVAAYYDSHGTANDRMLAHYLLGCVYREMQDAPKALSAYHDAVERADTISDDCDYALLCRIHGQTGELLYKQALFQSALSEYNKSYQYALKCNEIITAINFYEQKAKCFYNLGYTDSLLSVCMNANKMYRENGDDKAANTCLGSVVFTYLQQKNFEAAAKFLALYEHHSYLNEEGIKAYDPWKLLYVYKGNYYLGIGETDSASYFFRKVIGECKDLNTKISAYKGMLNVFKSLGIPDSLSKYALEYCAVSDSSIKTLNSTTIGKMQELYSYNHYQQEAEKSRHKVVAANLRTKIAILIIMILVLVSTSCYLIMYYIHKGKFRLLTAQYGANMLLFSETVSHLNTLKKQSATLNQQISQKEQEISTMRASLAEYQAGNRLPEDWVPADVIYDTAIVKKLHKLAMSGQMATDEYWNELRVKINEFMPDFIEKLSLSGATLDLKDTEICLLTKLRFSPGEQSVLLHIKPNTLSNRRVRLLKKLFHEEGSSVLFEEKICLL